MQLQELAAPQVMPSQRMKRQARPWKPVGQARRVVHGGSRALTQGDSTCTAGFVGEGGRESPEGFGC